MSDAGRDRGGAERAAIAQLREKIDAIDQKLVALLDERMELVMQVGGIKTTLDPTASARRLDREEQVYQLAHSASSVLSQEEIRNIFREIISCSLAREQRQQVAFLGPPGTFSQQAVRQAFGSSAATLPCSTVREVIRAVESGKAMHGMVPLENSSRGLVDEHLDLLTECDLIWSGEVLEPVQHCLMGQNPESPKSATRIFSHPQSFAQCRNWLQDHLPAVEQEPARSNGEAAEKASQQSGTLAIAPAIAAEVYGLKILEHSIQDRQDNKTRFVTVGRQATGPGPGTDKTSLMVASEDRPGALLDLLQILNRHDINMTALYSRPSGLKNWSFSFFLDVLGHRESPALRAALEELEQRKSLLRIFGSYPAAGNS